MAKKKKAPAAAKPSPVILGPHPVIAWISVKVALPTYDRPVFVTDGVELAHCSRENSDRHGEHYCLLDEGGEFTNVTHWCEEPLLPNGKRAKHG